MSSDIDPKIVKTTQDLLNKVVKKPALTEKLLKRPPFRFIHDIITNIIKSHGFLKDLYEENDLIAENVKEKESKIVFLQKAIDATGFIVGDVLSAKPSKIVAGLEVDKTNQWLQVLAKAVIEKKDSSAAVQQVLNGEKPTKRPNNGSVVVSTTTNDNKKKALNQNTKTPNNKNIKTKKGIKETKGTKNEAKIQKNETKDSNETKESIEGKERTPEEPLLSANKAKQNSPKQLEPDLATNSLNGNTSKPPSPSENSPKIDNNVNDSNDENVHKERDQKTNGIANNEEIVAQKPSVDQSVKTQRARPSNRSALPQSGVNNSETEIRSHARPPTRPPTRHDRTARPSSSRPAPPRVIPKSSEDNKIIEAELEEKMRLLNAKPVENLITENSANDEDLDFIVTDVVKPEDLESNERLEFDGNNNNNETQKGSLVKQLVDTKKELEGNQTTDLQTNNEKKPTQRQTNRDIEKLRQSIQALSQTANPLGKILDYLQEDIDSMVSELKTWQEEYKRNMQSLEKSRHNTFDELEPFKGELNQLDSDINEMIDKISVTKANIIRNDEKLQKMVSMINRI